VDTSTTPSRIPELDGLRGIAVILVVAIHYAYFEPSPGNHLISSEQLYFWFQRFFAIGWSGVDLFFVLSGFLIGGILLDAKDSPSYYKTFYLRRFFRILPLYYLWIFGYVFVMFTSHRWMNFFLKVPTEGPPDASVFWLFVFVQNMKFASYAALSWAWLSPTWSLAVEEQFYLIAPLLIRRLSRQALFRVMCLVAIAAPLARLWVRSNLLSQPVGLDQVYTLLPCRADALAFGVLTALAWRDKFFRKWLSRHTMTLEISGLVFLCGVLGLWYWSPNNFSLPMESFGYTWLGIFYALVLLLVLEKPSGAIGSFLRLKWLRELGGVSYCVYLIHGAMGWIFRAALEYLIKNPSVWERSAFCCAAAIVVYLLARASWRDIESPLLRRAQAYQY
jgi:peptidoglycan/LPS O-acetylase OafA/YrhL